MTSSVIKPADIREVAVIGLGLMGSGIAELVGRSGRRVVAIEVDRDFLDQGMARLGASLDKAVSKGKLADTARAELLARIRPTDDLAAGVAGADLVIEAIPERMELKKALFARLDQACRPHAILATNTSSLSITEIAGSTRYPARVAGLHFFNPAPVMKLVEVISTVLTSADTSESLALLAHDLGKTPVRTSDRAGFIVNALLQPYLNHAVHLLETGQAAREDIDKAATAGLGLPMGPLTLLDLIGLDTSLAILETLQAEFGGTRYLPAPLLRKLCDARLFGRKSGRGFYDYQRHSTSAADAGDRLASRALPTAVALLRDSGGLLDELAGAITEAGIDVLPRPSPETGLVIVAADPRHRVLDAALAAGHPADVVGIHLIETLAGKQKLAELVLPDVTAPGTAAKAAALAARLCLTAVTTRDRPGFLAAALAYAQFNDAVRMFQDGYASPADIDVAMMLGCGYPRGPFQMLDDAGPGHVVGVLEAMHAATGDPAFTPVPLLAEYATAGTRFHRLPVTGNARTQLNQAGMADSREGAVMDFELTDEQELVRSTVREFADAELAPIAGEIDRDHRFPHEILPKLAELNLMGMPYPEKMGGAGTDYVSYVIAVEEISRACASTGIILSVHTSLATWPVYKFGTPAQNDKYLPDMASGRRLGAFALTEPAAGTDAAAGTATAAASGDEYVLNGSKSFITNAPYADVYIVFAKTDPERGARGMSAFIVEKGTPGFTVGEAEHKLGIRGSSTPPIYFTDCRIPKDALLGKEGNGFKIAMQTLDGGRIGVAAQALGIAQAALDASIAYAKERVQFGKPIATFQAIQWMIADMTTEVDAARLLVYRAASCVNKGLPYSTDGAMAKLFASETATRVAGKAIQIHGGYGYTESYPVERNYRDAKITELYEGTSEAQRMVIARSSLR